MRLQVFTDEAAWVAAAREDFGSRVELARADGRVLELLLSGGTSPEPVFRGLASLRLRELPLRLWLGDERAVDTADPARNGILITRCFSGSDWEPRPDIRPWPPGEAPASAESYAAELLSAFGRRPSFDLAFLGIGGDGHTAGLFPGDPGSLAALDPSREDLAFATLAPTEPRRRMSMGAACLGGARVMRFLSKGKTKREILDRVLDEGGRGYPARIVAELAESRGADVAFFHLEGE
ncbi:MAG: 6-phosphogluconolactonase [Spirochaetota bacterium]